MTAFSGQEETNLSGPLNRLNAILSLLHPLTLVATIRVIGVNL